jgi:RecJ-like exonuclease
MLNPHHLKQEIISGAGVCYLFAKQLSIQNKDLASLAIVGMIGDLLDKNLGRTYNDILKDAETIVKRGFLLYPSTRPLDRALEYSSFYIPGVTGSYKGVIELLRDANIPRIENRYKSLYELTDEEMSHLITAIMLRSHQNEQFHDMLGNLFLIKFFNKLEDARELSAAINACSRMGHPYVALGFCLGNPEFKQKAEKIYVEYKQHLVSALKFIEFSEKISGENYTIINARNNIKDTLIGTVASILSHSPVYKEGTMIVALAYDQDKIKVSARIAGKKGRNVHEVLNQIVVPLGGEVGGHPNAAGCLIQKHQEETFIAELRKILDITIVNA